LFRALALFLFGTRWGWLLLGVIGLAVGGYFFFATQQLTFEQTSGTIASYQEVTRNGLYDRNELRLTDHTEILTLHKNDFDPELPDQVFHDGKVIVWTNTGTGEKTVYAITLYDESDENPQQYTTKYYEHPDEYQHDNQTLGMVIGGAGMLALLNGLFWPLLPWGRKRDEVPLDLQQPPPPYTGLSGTNPSPFR
jgi:hypothetical protein